MPCAVTKPKTPSAPSEKGRVENHDVRRLLGHGANPINAADAIYEQHPSVFVGVRKSGQWLRVGVANDRRRHRKSSPGLQPTSRTQIMSPFRFGCRRQIEMSALSSRALYCEILESSQNRTCHPHITEIQSHPGRASTRPLVIAPKGSLDGWSRCKTIKHEGNGRLRAKNTERKFVFGRIGHSLSSDN
jgi:hypothetical protein